MKGFTLIELMITIAILGIITALALPSYNDYLARSQISEPLGLLDGIKSPVSEWYVNQGSWPTLGVDVTIVSAGKFTGSITATASSGPALTLTAVMRTAGVNPNISGTSITYLTTDGGNTWICTAGTVNSRFLPASCR